MSAQENIREGYLSLDLPGLLKERGVIQGRINSLRNISQKALGQAPGARANLNSQIAEWSENLVILNDLINDLSPVIVNEPIQEKKEINPLIVPGIILGMILL